MYYVKKNPKVMEELLENDSSITSDDVVGLVHEINVECAMFSYEATHSVLEAYQASLEMSDSAEQAKKDVAAGNVTDAEFVEKPKEDDKPNDDKSKADEKPATQANAKAQEQAKKGIFQRIKSALQTIWNKIKELFQRFVNWIANKIESTDKFLDKVKDKKLGTVKIESHDFAGVFNRIRSVNEQGKKLFEVARKGFEDILDKGKKARPSKEILEAIAANRDEMNEYLSNINKSWFSSERYRFGDKANFPSVIKEGLLGEKKEREWKGEDLVKILKDNKDIRKTLEKLSFSTLDHIKLYSNYNSNANSLNATISGVFGVVGYEQFASFIMYASNKSAAMMAQTVLVAQSTIMELRAAINKCANASA